MYRYVCMRMYKDKVLFIQPRVFNYDTRVQIYKKGFFCCSQYIGISGDNILTRTYNMADSDSMVDDILHSAMV